MADKRNLNVNFGDLRTEINMQDVGDISDLQDKIKALFSNGIKAPAACSKKASTNK